MNQFPERKKRPPTVWLTQILIVLLGLSFASGMFRGIYSLITSSEAADFSGRRLLGFLLGCVFLIILGAAFWGLTKKAMWGKRLGVIALILIWALVLYSQLFPTNGPIRRYEYNNAAQIAGANAGMIMINILLGILTLRLALAKKVNRFFLKEPDDKKE